MLFHARIAEDAPQHAFTIDDVADALVRKLGNRVPAVLAGESISLEDQLAQWEERKALEKPTSGCRLMDDVPTAQPALALAQKVLARVDRRGARDLIPTTIAVGHGRGRQGRRERACAQRFWSSWTPCAPSNARSRDRRDADARQLDVAERARADDRRLAGAGRTADGVRGAHGGPMTLGDVETVFIDSEAEERAAELAATTILAADDAEDQRRAASSVEPQ